MQVAGNVPEITLGWRLRIALEDAEVTVQEMADYLGVTRQTVGRWMHDRGQTPRAAFVKQWAMRTGVDVTWLETGKAPSPTGDGASADWYTHRDLNPEPAD